MLFQNIQFKLARKEQIAELMAKLRLFMEKYNLQPTSTQFYFDEQTSAKSSPCERAIKQFPQLKPYLREVVHAQTGPKQVITNRNQGPPLIGIDSDRPENESPSAIEDPSDPHSKPPGLDVSFDVLAEMMVGVPKRFAFNHALVIASNVYWPRNDKESILVKAQPADTGFMVRIASSWWVNGRFSSLRIQIETTADANGRAQPLPAAMMEDLQSIGKIDSKKTRPFSPEQSVEKLQTAVVQTATNAARRATVTKPAKELSDRIHARLSQLYAQGQFPHRLEDWLVLRHYEKTLPDGRQVQLPPEWVPLECVFHAANGDLPATLTTRMDAETRRLQQLAIEGLGSAAQKMLVAEAVIEGVQCDVWPYLVKAPKAIPRKKLVAAAFSTSGYEVGDAQSGTLSISKQTKDYTIECFFDFGSWSRNMTIMSSVGANGVKVPVPVLCWTAGNVPILNEALFKRAIENAAFSAKVIENEYVAEIVELLHSA